MSEIFEIFFGIFFGILERIVVSVLTDWKYSR